ncbi:hypothetical protein FN846DRAFT_772846, partial [Sphaerosporella brunnea]
RLFDLFCPGVHALVRGALIDRSYNGITMILQYHRYFGSMRMWFEQVPDKPNTYRMHTRKGSPSPPLQFGDPGEITFKNHDPNKPHSLPSAALLEVHAACCKILNASGAGEYLEKLLRDLDEIDVLAEDGSTGLEALWIASGLVRAQV